MYNPFGKNEINHIFRFKEGSSTRLITRESTQIEFKQNFNWGNKAKYAKTMAAFANTNGGFIIFGVKDSPKEAVGLSNNKFEDIDEEKITSYLNEFFSPEIIWAKQFIEINDLKFGLIYTAKAINKPIVCSKNDNFIKESDIYYRYNGRSERIKYPELRALLNEEREKEKLLWMKHMQKISKIGVGNVALLDLEEGSIQGSGGKIYLDEEIVHQIDFIKEGEFNEVKGAKTLKLVGEVKETSRTVILPTKTKKVGIHTREIIEALLYGKLHEGTNAREYLETLPFERSKFMPIFVFMSIGNIDDEEAINIFRTSDSTATQLKLGLIERVTEIRDFSIGYLDDYILETNIVFSNYNDYINYIENNNGDKSIKKSLIYNLMISKSREALYEFAEAKLICEVVTLLDADEISDLREFLKDLLLYIFKGSYTKVAPDFRYALAHIDQLIYRSQCTTNSII